MQRQPTLREASYTLALSHRERESESLKAHLHRERGIARRAFKKGVRAISFTSRKKKKQTENSIPLTSAQLKSRQHQLLVVDIRGWLEYWMGHIPGAQRLSRNQILKDIPKDQAIALTCLSGHRSAIAAQWLVTQGYRQVYNLQGGLMAWQGAGYTVQRGNRP